MEKLIKNVDDYLKELIGLPVSLPWTGYGTAIFLELGKLKRKKSIRRNYEVGEACIHVSWDWRLEKGTQVLFGSSNSLPFINDGIKTLKGNIIEYIKIIGLVREIEIGFSDNSILKSMIMIDDDPEWSIKIKNGKYIYPKDGNLYLGVGIRECTEEEKAEIELSEKAAERWGVPIEEPLNGNCDTCHYYRRMDGHAAFLDYGVCVYEGGKFEGKVVNFRSGCSKFTEETVL
jgi:hypothetical protein